MRLGYGLTVTTIPRTRAHRDTRSDHGYLTTDACEWPPMRVFEHCEACPAPCGGGALTRSMRRVANLRRGYGLTVTTRERLELVDN
jgi:hypothetical protein